MLLPYKRKGKEVSLLSPPSLHNSPGNHLGNSKPEAMIQVPILFWLTANISAHTEDI